MQNDIIDYRSDTVTQPSIEMMQQMMAAKVGDDGFGDDPTTNELQKFAAEMFGMEAALFCPSGTMTNQIAVKTHTSPGEEIICEAYSHTYYHEAGGIAFNSGCQVRPIDGHYGIITAAEIEGKIIPRDDIHRAPTALVVVENTTNFGGGHCYPDDTIDEIKALCDERNIRMHLDGARLFNALVATGQQADYYGKRFDSISICLSKGLGAPVGSLLLGDDNFIQKAKRYRKIFGGEMRQTGYLAAAGLYALKNNIDRLETDHKHAKKIAEVLNSLSYIGNVVPVETNIIIFDVQGRFQAHQLSELLQQHNIKTIPINEKQIRMVTHINISDEMIDKTIEILKTLDEG